MDGRGHVNELPAEFQALSDPIRREILAMLRAGPMAAGDIASHFNVSGATISHHLSILRTRAWCWTTNRESTSIMS